MNGNVQIARNQAEVARLAKSMIESGVPIPARVSDEAKTDVRIAGRRPKDPNKLPGAGQILTRNGGRSPWRPVEQQKRLIVAGSGECACERPDGVPEDWEYSVKGFSFPLAAAATEQTLQMIVTQDACYDDYLIMERAQDILVNRIHRDKCEILDGGPYPGPMWSPSVTGYKPIDGCLECMMFDKRDIVEWNVVNRSGVAFTLIINAKGYFKPC